MVIHHLLTGMILQVGPPKSEKNTTKFPQSQVSSQSLTPAGIAGSL